MKLYKVNKNISSPTFSSEQISLPTQIPTGEFAPNFCGPKSLDFGSDAPLDFGSDAPLGINTKSISALATSGVLKAPFDHSILRRERYALQRVARGIFAHEGSRLGMKYILNYHRAAHCAYTMLASDVGVWESIEHKRAHFDNLMFCGSASACPCCTVKIQERRRGEISTGMDHFYNSLSNKKAIMVTLTFPHGLGDDLKKLLSQQSDALMRLRGGRPWTAFKSAYGFEGLIRSLEVTYGDNGFHPHTHELWFVDESADVEKMKSFILERWLKMCSKAGLVDCRDLKAVTNFKNHAVDIKDNASNSEYLAKMDDSKHWGADRELAKGSTKIGKKSGMHPFSFLTKYEETSDPKWSKLWLEYCAAFKGKRLIYWSAGLKKRVGLEEKTDEEIVVEKDDKAIEIIRLDKMMWLKVSRNNMQSLVLETCEATKNKDVIMSVINNFKDTKFDLIKSIKSRMCGKDKL